MSIYYKLQERFSNALQVLESKKNYPERLQAYMADFLPLAHELNVAMLEVCHENDIKKDELNELDIEINTLYSLISEAEKTIDNYNKKIKTL